MGHLLDRRVLAAARAVSRTGSLQVVQPRIRKATRHPVSVYNRMCSSAYDATCRSKCSLTFQEAARSFRRSPLLTYPSLDHLQVRLFDPVEYFDVAPHVIALTGPNQE